MDHAAYVRETMRPLLPSKTGLTAKLPALSGIEAVVFDIYGTLLISGAGEISPAAGVSEEGATKNEDERDAAAASFAEAEFGVKGEEFFRVYQEMILRRQKERRLFGVEYPEVDIREVWVDTLAALGLPSRRADAVEELSVRFECAVNPVWVMPGALEVLWRVGCSGLKMGIISNAQFYTLPVMEGLFGKTLDGLGFDPSLRVFSYALREGKPSPRLFEELAVRAGTIGIEPGRIFYLGNDLLKDVLPARSVGFRTGLFAGDAGSLRLAGRSAGEAASLADAVITDLAQIPPLLKIST